MKNRLFRQEVLAENKSSSEGQIILARPISMRAATFVAATILVALGLLLTLGHYTRKVRVTGQITPAKGAVKVVATQFGHIRSSNVSEGQVVNTGQLMFEVANERMSGGTAVDARIASALTARRLALTQGLQTQLQQLEQQKHSLETRRQLIEAEIANRRQEAALHETQVLSAVELFKSYSNLKQAGFLSSAQLAQTKAEVAMQQAKLKTVEANLLSLKRELLQTLEEIQAIDLQRKLFTAHSNQSLSTLEQEAAEHGSRRAIQIVAPASGIVTAITLEPGQTVTAGGSLATILPADGGLESHLWVPSRAIGFVEPGQEVLLRIDAFSYQKFGAVEGRVISVERSPINPHQAMDGRADGELFYRVSVRLSKQSIKAYGRTLQFKSGMTLKAEILQDRRRLIEWLVDPITSASNSDRRNRPPLNLALAGIRVQTE